MKATITNEQAMAAAKLIKEYAATQKGCKNCVFFLPGSARCIIAHSGCACAWKIPEDVKEG